MGKLEGGVGRDSLTGIYSGQVVGVLLRVVVDEKFTAGS